jgi:hypothetical protein
MNGSLPDRLFIEKSLYDHKRNRSDHEQRVASGCATASELRLR